LRSNITAVDTGTSYERGRIKDTDLSNLTTESVSIDTDEQVPGGISTGWGTLDGTTAVTAGAASWDSVGGSDATAEGRWAISTTTAGSKSRHSRAGLKRPTLLNATSNNLSGFALSNDGSTGAGRSQEKKSSSGIHLELNWMELIDRLIGL